MYDYSLHQKIKWALLKNNVGSEQKNDLSFYSRLIANAAAIKSMYDSLYEQHQDEAILFNDLIDTLAIAHKNSEGAMQKKILKKKKKGFGF